MEATNIRAKALEVVQARKALEPVPQNIKISDIFGENVFSNEILGQYLTGDMYEDFLATVRDGANLTPEMADTVAQAMKSWSISKGVTHYTHWFQPLTGLTAEKHDAFLSLENGKPVEAFSGSNLAQQEPDASSLPSGGLRNTFEARGYTAWDPSSPAFIFENKYGKTLCIPTIFVSYTGEALDYKAPLLKSIHSLEKAAVTVCQMFDRNIKKVTPTLGAEQEYFLVDRAWYDLRPDLVLCGRTLVGAPPARGQQLEDHYFGSISERVFAFMNDLEHEAYRLGIPLKTRHNEVAPSQFECAPIFEEQNVAGDHNTLLTDLIDRVARKHNFRALLHEKPFAGINGSGKHNNWSLGTDTGRNLLSPGKAPKDNLMFLTFFVNAIKAVFEHADLLRASIASAANDHRLGANEAPPAIMSVFIGEYLSKMLDEIEKPSRKKTDTPKAYLKLGIPKIPELLLDNTDRNRTSPFAFTGNKFEFRAVGSSANIAGSMTVLNSIVANQLIEFKKTVDRKVTRGKKKEVAILEVLRQYIKDSKNIRFEGNGYGDEWVKEAESRGLSNIRTTPRALDALVSDSSKELFTKLGIYTDKEMEARHEIRLEDYIKKVEIEALVLSDLSMNNCVPAAIRYQTHLANNVEALMDIEMDKSIYGTQIEMIKDMAQAISNVRKGVSDLEEVLASAKSLGNSRDIAIMYSDKVMPLIESIREDCDKLEVIVPDGLWQLPKYREMLFIR